MSSSGSEAWDGVPGVPLQEESLHALLAEKTTIRFYDHEASWLPEYRTVTI